MALIYDELSPEIMVGGGKDISYYPEINDLEFVKKISLKKEFFIHKNRKIKDENFKTLHGDYLPDPSMSLLPHQRFARSFINPETPYNAALLFHDTGTGKTLSAIAIAEGFKEHIINLRRMGRSAWVYIIADHGAQNRFFEDLINKTIVSEYATPDERAEYFTLQKIPESERNAEVITRIKDLKRDLRARLMSAKQNGIYKFVSFREFQNHTIGRREKEDGKTQLDEDGNVIRINPTEEIKNLDNCILIIDEAHRTEGNDWMVSIKDVLKKSKNTKIILMTATPMYHSAKEIIEILNLLAEPNKELTKNNLFNKDDTVKDSGLEAIRDIARGKILYLRGKDPARFPEVIQMGTLPPAKLKLLPSDNEEIDNFRMKYTKIVRVPMGKYHYEAYKKFNGKLSTENRMITDLVLPTPKGTENYGFDKRTINDIAHASDEWCKKHKIRVYRDSEKVQRISGEILNVVNIGNYSAKYKKVLEDIFSIKGKLVVYEELIEGLGINLFTEILIENGYTPVKNNLPIGVSSTVREKQRCYSCAGLFNSSGYKKPNDHVCSPAYFVVLIGTGESRHNQDQIISKYNDYANITGIDIKLILGSGVIKESVDLKDTRAIMILNYQHNFSSIKQIEGRGARNLSHIRLKETERNIKIYKYVSTVPNDEEESLEELKYRKEEYAHINIQKIARTLKEVAVDCYLNKSVNITEAEKNSSKNCETKQNHHLCTPDCDYMDCNYSCEYEPKKDPSQVEIDVDTFQKHELYQRKEIIQYIKKLYKFDVVWDADSIIKAVKNSDKFPLVDELLILDIVYEMLTIKTLIHNSFGTPGYILSIDKYLLFQPLGILEALSVEERRLAKKSHDKFFVSCSEFVNLRIKKSLENENSIDNILKMINMYTSRSEIAKVLGELPIVTQIKLLELSIENINAKNSSNYDNYIKILANYSEYLITDKQLSDNSNYSRHIHSDIAAEKFIGHFFGNHMRCHENNTWVKCKTELSQKKQDLMKVNDYIIGYIDKTKIGKIVFKLKFVKDTQDDRRRENKGFVCKQVNNKNLLVDIAQNLGISKDITDRNIARICDIVELKLRDLQYEEKNKGVKKRFFYEYIESHLVP
jgi:superfamily II DNA or RNA helicase